jgi:hypothetical protein
MLPAQRGHLPGGGARRYDATVRLDQLEYRGGWLRAAVLGMALAARAGTAARPNSKGQSALASRSTGSASLRRRRRNPRRDWGCPCRCWSAACTRGRLPECNDAWPPTVLLSGGDRRGLHRAATRRVGDVALDLRRRYGLHGRDEPTCSGVTKSRDCQRGACPSDGEAVDRVQVSRAVGRVRGRLLRARGNERYVVASDFAVYSIVST